MTEFDATWCWVQSIPSRLARETVEREHYLHRKPNCSHAFGLFNSGRLVGVVCFGTPPSRHLQVSVCALEPSLVIELNRLWVCDSQGRNAESWFVAQALRMLPPMIVVSYADTAHAHVGYIYRALNFNYSGWTDMDRKTPRHDYVTPGKHSRSTFREGAGAEAQIVKRKPKAKYWLVTGNRRERKQLERLCDWPKLDWKNTPLPTEETAVCCSQN